MWSIDYVQVPDEEEKDKEKILTNKEETKPTTDQIKTNEIAKPLPIHSRLVKQINVSNDSIGSGLIKSGSESSLSEDSTVRRGSIEHQRSGEISSKEWRTKQQEEKDTCSDTEEVTPPVPPVRRRSRIHASPRKSEGEFL